MALPIAAGDRGSKWNAAPSVTSANAPPFEHATGTPRAIASSTGSPNPS